MVKNISIENFKSIKSLSFEARRVNVFIGEPNTGKSNILEALAFFNFYNEFGKLREYVRYSNYRDFFNKVGIKRNDPNELSIRLDEFQINCLIESNSLFLRIKDFERTYVEDALPYVSEVTINEEGEIRPNKLSLDSNRLEEDFPKLRYYKFSVGESSKLVEYKEELSTPFGNNLFDVLLSNREIKNLIGEILLDKGLEINLNVSTQKVEIIKERIENITVSLPYSSMSDTLQRVIFYLAAMLSNKNSSLIFEEPESNIFPFYNQYLAETIGLDEESGNQYFIATHNPYFLGSIAQKTKTEDLAVFITYMENHETKLRPLREDEFPELFDYDIFYNLERFIES